MEFEKVFGNTPFEQAQAGIARRVMINGAIMATKQLIVTYKDIDDGRELVKDGLIDDPTIDIDELFKFAAKDEEAADLEVIALSNMLESHMGISA
tara:strand:- start:76 stop:360 length:285 start_codon:yes stop_codon:yes gene_type:complete